jgi:hypothetical protein
MKKTNRANLNYTKVIVGIAICLCVGALGYVFSQFKTTSVKFSKNEIKQINYDMVKLETKSSDYSLSDREVESVYQALEKRNENELAINEKQAQKGKAVTNKKTAQKDVKKEDKKTKTAVTKIQKNESQKRSELYAKANQKMIEQIKNNRKNESVRPEAVSTNAIIHSGSAVFNNSARSAAALPQTSPVKQAEDVKEVKSIDQWKSEIITAQNKDTVLKFAAAFKKGEVSVEDFKSLTTEFVKNDDQKIVGLGLYILRASPSQTSYSLLVQSQNQLSSEYALYVQESLLSYNQTTYLNILKNALLDSDKVIVAKTLSIINLGLTRIKEGTSSELVDSRYRRFNQAQAFSITNYASFIPDLQKIMSSNDAELSQLASQNIDLIGPQVVAAN